MPRILNGQIVSGRGTINVNDVAVQQTAGSPGWVSPSQIVGNGALPPSQSQNYYVVTLPPSGPASLLWNPGAGTVVAGSGVIAAALAPPGQTPTVRLMNAATGPTPITLDYRSAFDVDREQGTALLGLYPDNTTLGVWAPTNGTPTPTQSWHVGPIYNARILGGLICWAQPNPQGIVKPYGIDYAGGSTYLGELPTVPAGNVFQPLLMRGPTGAKWIIYVGQEGAVYLHTTDDPTMGHQLPNGPHFGLDMEYQGHDTVLVAWCQNEGESAGSLQTVLWSLTQLEPLTPSEPEQPIPPDPEPPVPQPPDPVFSTGGTIAMSDTIKSLIQHYGKKPLDGGLTAYFTSPDQSTVASSQPDGSIENRPASAIGPWEQFKEDGQIATANPDGKLNSYVVANVSGL